MGGWDPRLQVLGYQEGSQEAPRRLPLSTQMPLLHPRGRRAKWPPSLCPA